MNNKQILNIYDWIIDDLSNIDFWLNFDNFISDLDFNRVVEYGNPISHKETKKFVTEFNSFLWNVSANKIKYFFDFSFEMFNRWLNFLSDRDYQFYKKLILGFETESMVLNLIKDPTFQSFIIANEQIQKSLIDATENS